MSSRLLLASNSASSTTEGTENQQQQKSGSSVKVRKSFLVMFIVIFVISSTFIYLVKNSMLTFEADADFTDGDESDASSSSSTREDSNGAQDKQQSSSNNKNEKSKQRKPLPQRPSMRELIQRQAGNANNNRFGSRPTQPPPPPIVPSPLPVNKDSNSGQLADNFHRSNTKGGRSKISSIILQHQQERHRPNPDADRKEQQALNQAADNLREPSPPLKCRRNRVALENHHSLIQRYGSVNEGGWCELITEPVPELSGVQRKDFGFRSSLFHDENLPGMTYRMPNKKRVDNESTYFDYRGSADGADWKYLQCPIKHRVHCHTQKLRELEGENNLPGASNNHLLGPNKKLLRSKALVIYIVSSAHEWLQRLKEGENLNFFLEHGLIPANTSTALFDEVEYVFAKIQHNLKEHSEESAAKFFDCGSVEEALLQKKLSSDSQNLPNIRFLKVPKAPCDLCAHARIMDFLGVLSQKNRRDNDHAVRIRLAQDNDTHSYSHVVMMNSGVQGPFFVNDEDVPNEINYHGDPKGQLHPPTTWLDYLAMAGRKRIPNPRLGFFHHELNERRSGSVRNAQDKDDAEWHECPIHVAAGVSISWEGPVHIQTFLVSAPFEAVRARYFDLYSSNCGGGGKGGCIVGGEIRTGKVMLDTSATTSIYSLGKQFHVLDTAGDNGAKRRQYYVPPRNPCYTWNDPCKAVFLKTGGGRVRDVMPPVANAVEMLVMGMTEKKAKYKTGFKFDVGDFDRIQSMFAERKCKWLFVNTSQFGYYESTAVPQN